MNLELCKQLYEIVNPGDYTYPQDSDGTYVYRIGVDASDDSPYDLLYDYPHDTQGALRLIEDCFYHVTIEWDAPHWTVIVDDFAITGEAKHIDLSQAICDALLNYDAKDKAAQR